MWRHVIVVISAEAQADLQRIGDYIARVILVEPRRLFLSWSRNVEASAIFFEDLPWFPAAKVMGFGVARISFVGNSRCAKVRHERQQAARLIRNPSAFTS